MALEVSFTTIKCFIIQATDVRCFITIGSLAVGLNAADLKLQGGWLFIRRHDTQQNDILQMTFGIIYDAHHTRHLAFMTLSLKTLPIC
jgi:hypothetical protein